MYIPNWYLVELIIVIPQSTPSRYDYSSMNFSTRP